MLSAGWGLAFQIRGGVEGCGRGWGDPLWTLCGPDPNTSLAEASFLRPFEASVVDGCLKCSHCELCIQRVGGRNFQKTDDRWVYPAQPSFSWRPQEEGSHGTACVLRHHTHSAWPTAIKTWQLTLQKALWTLPWPWPSQRWVHSYGTVRQERHPLWPTWPLILAWWWRGPRRSLQGVAGGSPGFWSLIRAPGLGAVRGGWGRMVCIQGALEEPGCDSGT